MYLHGLSEAAERVFEIRAFAGGRTHSGYFDNIDIATEVAFRLTSRPDCSAVYVTLNPCNPALLARSCNRVRQCGPKDPTTADNDIARLCHLLIDIDPLRPSGISSSMEEHAAAIQFASALREDLSSIGFPAPLMSDSGNGAHLLCKLDLPNDPENVDLLKRVLQGIQGKYEDSPGCIVLDGVRLSVDQKVYNPSRISKVYGTWTRKGDSTSDRPHRVASVLLAPQELIVLTRELLESIALPASAKSSSKAGESRGESSAGSLNVQAYLEHYGRKLLHVKTNGGSTLYVLECCIFDPSHAGGEAAIGQTEDGKLFYQCFHDSCKGKTWKDARRIISGDDKLGRFMPGGSSSTNSGSSRNSSHPNGNEENSFEPPLPLRRPLPPTKPYPMEVLGPILGMAAAAIHRGIQAPLAICCQSVLAAGCLAVQALADVTIDGRRIPLSCYFLSIASSGERKSSVDTEALRSHREFQARLQERFGQEHRDYIDQIDAWKKAREQQLKKAKSFEEKKQVLAEFGDPPTAPIIPLLFAQEPTFEGLFKLLRDGRPSVGLFSDEAGTFVGGHGMNEDNRLKMGAGLSVLWDGKPLTRTRAGDGAMELHGRRVCAHLMAQPNVAENLLSDGMLLEQGLISRFLVCYPDSTAGTRFYRGIDLTQDPAMRTYHKRVHDLLDTDLPASPTDPQVLFPPVLSLTGDARSLWVEYHDSVERELSEGALLAPVRGFANKAPEHALRLAGVLTIFDNPQVRAIDKKHMVAGIELARYYTGEALRLFHAGTCKPEILQAEKLLQWLKEKEYIYLGAVYQYGPNSIREASVAKPLMKLLEEHGWVTRLEEPMEIDGKVRRQAWRVWKDTADPGSKMRDQDPPHANAANSANPESGAEKANSGNSESSSTPGAESHFSGFEEEEMVI